MKLVLPLPPLGNRYLRKCRTHIYKTDEAKQYCAEVARIGRERGIEPILGDVGIIIYVYRARRAGDLDAFYKVLLDSLEGVCYLNDRQIIEHYARRFDDKLNPRVEITVVEIKQDGAPESQAAQKRRAKKEQL